MTVATADSTSTYPRYRAPAKPNTAMVVPELGDVEELATRRVSFDGGGHLEFCGKSLEEAREYARAEVARLAWEYTRGYADISEQTIAGLDRRCMVLSGHQPELFHPGVWYKNFLLSHLAEATGALSINFLVDNDVCRSTAIQVPRLDEHRRWHRTTVAFDEPRPPIPWEMRRIESWATWENFPHQVRATMVDPADDLLLDYLWGPATTALRRSYHLGMALAEGRHRLEREEGLHTLEVPLSRLVSTRSFARFSIHLLADLPRFQLVYNSQRDRYRQAHKIRNEAHPVPPLEEQGDWLEAPWWVYRSSDPTRRPLWVRMANDSLILSDRAGWQAVIEGRLDCDGAASQWLEFLADGICLRPRALLTTMYLRLFVSDLFLHGIGGGKYDQLTNGIIEEFFQLVPPPLAVASATIPLPQRDRLAIRSVDEIEEQLRMAKQAAWDLQHNADKYLEQLVDRADHQLPEHDRRQIRTLVHRKQELLQHIPPRGEKSEWHQQMRGIKESLQALAARFADAAEQQVEHLEQALEQARVAGSREFAFCLFGRSYLVPLLKRLAKNPTAS
ncbi:MAG: hypothetical protein KatS3mg111_0309 [Pirellulaceae bacterium]|nr:MAG: hypothetical protein KatS3mg111_0309 [Pirellulaceae bacterium]